MQSTHTADDIGRDPAILAEEREKTIAHLMSHIPEGDTHYNAYKAFIDGLVHMSSMILPTELEKEEAQRRLQAWVDEHPDQEYGPEMWTQFLAETEYLSRLDFAAEFTRRMIGLVKSTHVALAMAVYQALPRGASNDSTFLETAVLEHLMPTNGEGEFAEQAKEYVNRQRQRMMTEQGGGLGALLQSLGINGGSIGSRGVVEVPASALRDLGFPVPEDAESAMVQTVPMPRGDGDQDQDQDQPAAEVDPETRRRMV